MTDTTTDTASDGRRRVAELVSEAKVAMLTTRTAGGQQVSRPMGLQEVEFDGDLWFFAYEDSAKVAQIRADSAVNVSFSDTKNTSWTSIAGRAEVVHDRARAEELYTPTLKAWFPDGLDTPGLTLIKIQADSAEYWEGPSSTVGFALGTLRAAVTKNPDSDPITNDTVQL
ncbi:pyridoxamine 5'-phosphate oxidase family protein [Auraticoccus monumenti]|uniref:General stress protein 26 n=1 Tax=Auraticoccus monumenti TaxID=675864 RepID=A0A1G6Z0Z4_9ACTN|nr:pyridoxamine 5'-phosphate oxidase family protein [Auraticoccus monumenti]SDD96202.1 General stress protein 26 [Auraticoccus monumenti]